MSAPQAFMPKATKCLISKATPVDPNSRHKGKFHTEDYLANQGIPFTAIRPVYIYGPQNYNPLEEWFF